MKCLSQRSIKRLSLQLLNELELLLLLLLLLELLREKFDHIRIQWHVIKQLIILLDNILLVVLNRSTSKITLIISLFLTDLCNQLLLLFLDLLLIIISLQRLSWHRWLWWMLHVLLISCLLIKARAVIIALINLLNVIICRIFTRRVSRVSDKRWCLLIKKPLLLRCESGVVFIEQDGLMIIIHHFRRCNLNTSS